MTLNKPSATTSQRARRNHEEPEDQASSSGQRSREITHSDKMTRNRSSTTTPQQAQLHREESEDQAASSEWRSREIARLEPVAAAALRDIGSLCRDLEKQKPGGDASLSNLVDSIRTAKAALIWCSIQSGLPVIMPKNPSLPAPTYGEIASDTGPPNPFISKDARDHFLQSARKAREIEIEISHKDFVRRYNIEAMAEGKPLLVVLAMRAHDRIAAAIDKIATEELANTSDCPSAFRWV